MRIVKYHALFVFVKKKQNLKLSSAANYRWRFFSAKNIGPGAQKIELKIENIFFSINFNICFGRSKLSTHRDSSFD